MINFDTNNSENEIDSILSEESKELTLQNEEDKDNTKDAAKVTNEYYDNKHSTTDDYYNKYKLPSFATINTGEEIKTPNDYDTRANPDNPAYTQMYVNGHWYDINISPNSIILTDQEVEALKTDKDAAKYDKGKLQITLMPTEIIRAITEVRMFGAKKYKPANWINVSKRRYKDALLRHILEYIDNEDAVDSESGLPALWHAACNIAFLIDMHRKDWDKRKEQITKNFADMEK